MFPNKWIIQHHDDIQNLAKGETLYLTWQYEMDGPFCDTHTVIACDPACMTDFLCKANNEGRYVLWMRVPPVPNPPNKYRILKPRVCMRDAHCAYNDDGIAWTDPRIASSTLYVSKFSWKIKGFIHRKVGRATKSKRRYRERDGFGIRSRPNSITFHNVGTYPIDVQSSNKAIM